MTELLPGLESEKRSREPIDLRCGRWQDVLADVECDALICDPPYSERTHEAQRYGARATGYKDSWVSSSGLEYTGWTAENVDAFCAHWASRCHGWIVALTDSELYPAWRDALRRENRYVFHPLPIVLRGMNVRLGGDGPSSWAVWCVVSRPRSLAHWGTLDGAYVGSPGAGPERAGMAVRGAKPLWLMRALVRDYSRPGDLICDPCAGGATTLLAAAIEGRRAVGAEMDPKTFALAQKRLARGFTPAFDFEAESELGERV